MHQRVPRWRMCGLELHGQGAETALRGALEGLAILQQCAVQVEADVCLQALREPLQHLVRWAHDWSCLQVKDDLSILNRYRLSWKLLLHWTWVSVHNYPSQNVYMYII